ncbi:hypothetical protein QTP88_012389 [Uroleucon formosanum]
MSLKLLQSLVSKNEFFTKTLLKREYYHLINRSQFKNCSLRHQIKFNPYGKGNLNIHKTYMSKQFSVSNNLTEIDFEQACNETLESLCEYFEQIVEDNPHLENPDILFNDGVLTIQLGKPYGTYVINRQTPNKQIWLSSPTSGPKRYDFDGTKWIYKHDGVSLHELLTSELSKQFSFDVNFSKCLFSGTLSQPATWSPLNIGHRNRNMVHDAWKEIESKLRNFLMSLELIFEFDPFLAQHINKYGNAGRGLTSYLSSTVFEEVISIMAEKVNKYSVDEIKCRKYFFIIVDSTPDIKHIDQLSFIVRYVNDQGLPVERFLEFIPKAGHKSAELFDVVNDFIKRYGLDWSNCRGQSYDDANDMSGSYSGLQARVKEINNLIYFVPCAAHSLNLVGTHAVDNSKEAVKYFGLMQHLFTFFTISTHRWKILGNNLKPGTHTLKHPSFTRWSSRDAACLSINANWSEIINALTYIMNATTPLMLLQLLKY